MYQVITEEDRTELVTALYDHGFYGNTMQGVAETAVKFAQNIIDGK